MSEGLLAWPLEGSRVRVVAPGGDAEAHILRTSDGNDVGAVALRRDGDGVFIEALCIDEAFRGYGLGSETARLVIDAVIGAGFGHVRAWAPPNLGLAVYFWFRMGLRPVHGPGPGGGLELRRDVFVATREPEKT